MLWLFDAIGIVALVWSIAVDNVYPAMTIGYSMTAASFIIFAACGLYNYCKRNCCRRRLSF